MNGSGATDNDNFQIRMTKSVPAQYFSEATVCVFLPNIHASAFLGGECKIVRCKIVRKKKGVADIAAPFLSVYSQVNARAVFNSKRVGILEYAYARATALYVALHGARGHRAYAKVCAYKSESVDKHFDYDFYEFFPVHGGFVLVMK